MNRAQPPLLLTAAAPLQQNAGLGEDRYGPGTWVTLLSGNMGDTRSVTPG
jgi:hypothetical protein